MGNRKSIWRAVTTVLLIGSLSSTALAADEEPLARVTIPDEYTDTVSVETMRRGVQGLWEVIEPHALRHQITTFPTAQVWGFDTVAQAAQHTGLSGFWGNSVGYALPGVAYIRLTGNHRGDLNTTVHEATHVLQYALSGPDNGHRCIAEGAAVWYAAKVLDHMGEQGPLDTQIRNWKHLNSEDRLVDVDEEVEAQLREYGYEPNPLPSFRELTTGSQWETARAERGASVYTLCGLAFDMLVELEGEARYFDYMAALRSTGWQTAFNSAFSEDLPTFETRLTTYRETWFEDYRLPWEVAYDAVISRLRSCESTGLWAVDLCVS